MLTGDLALILGLLLLAFLAGLFSPLILMLCLIWRARIP